MRPITRVQGSQVLGIGTFRPPRVVANTELLPATGHTGRMGPPPPPASGPAGTRPGDTIAAMAVHAAGQALSTAGVARRGRRHGAPSRPMSDVRQSPAAAPEIASRVRRGAGPHGAGHRAPPAPGSPTAWASPTAMVRAGAARHVLLVGVERMTDIVSPHDTTGLLFGDGAGAAIRRARCRHGHRPDRVGRRRVAPAPHTGMLRSWVEYRDRPELAWPTMAMAGREVFRWRWTPGPTRGRPRRGGRPHARRIDALVPHQANLRIIERVAGQLDLKPGTPVADDIVRSGNTSAASIPLALGGAAGAGPPSHRTGSWPCSSASGPGRRIRPRRSYRSP
ncbi:beta-ketoacyl-ACP synthase III [Dactylosporangium vinaceum]